jgi:addiction module HigA family antidote
MTKCIELPTIGEILKEEFIDAFKISQNALAKAVFVPPNRIHQIVNNTRRITADTDLRLTKFFGVSEGYFLRIQEGLELRQVKRKIANEINSIQPIKQHA